jgi:membrane associated rhomboid family serine protease
VPLIEAINGLIVYVSGDQKMFPIGDDDSSRRTVPVVTYVLIVLNLLFFFVELSGGEPFIERWSVVPRRLLENPGGDFLTVFTSMFMHAGWVHLLGNMLYLWIFGDNVEDAFGHVKYLLFYLLCGVAATLAQLVFTAGSNVPNLGASGAIAGVLGSYILLFPRGQVKVLMGRGVIPMPALVVIGLWIVLQFVSGLGSITNRGDTGGVAYMAHIGGFLAGVILTLLLRATGGTSQENA